MARFDDLARERTDLSEADVDHLRALIADWTLLSDLAFADLVLWLPTWHGAGFVAAAQVRPTTGPTGCSTTSSDRRRPRAPPHARPGGRRARVVADRGSPAPAAIEATPVSAPGAGHRRGRPALRRSRAGLRPRSSRPTSRPPTTSSRWSRGHLPPASRWPAREPPRVGDGLIRLDAEGVVMFASPNARSAYHRLGLATDLVGADLARRRAGSRAAPARSTSRCRGGRGPRGGRRRGGELRRRRDAARRSRCAATAGAPAPWCWSATPPSCAAASASCSPRTPRSARSTTG